MKATIKFNDGIEIDATPYVYKGTYGGYEWEENVELAIEKHCHIDTCECCDGEKVSGVEHFSFFDMNGDENVIALLVVKA